MHVDQGRKGAVWQLSLHTPVIATAAPPVTGRLRAAAQGKYMLFHAKYNAGRPAVFTSIDDMHTEHTKRTITNDALTSFHRQP
jgi:hypothetical protein